MKNITDTNAQREKWRRDPISFIESVLYDPETNRPFTLYREQKIFVRAAFEQDADGRMRYTDLCWSSGKKGGKTALAAMIAIYTGVVLAGNGGEIAILANDRDQAQSRVYKAVVNILRASPLLKDSAVIGVNSIVFRATNTEIKAYASDYAGFSGSNPTANIYDEGAYFTSESARRLWDEGISSPARKISFRLSVSTAGFDGESSPLRDTYDRIMSKGVKIAPNLRRDGKLLVYWASGLPDSCRAPWQSKAWIEEQRATFTARPHQFARLIENQWTSNEDVFIALEQWDRCVDPSAAPILSDSRLDVWVGLDASVNRDSTAIICCAWDAAAKRVRLIRHRVFVPSKANPIDFENQVEAEILDLRGRFHLRQVLFDPYQLVSVSQRMIKLGIPMEALNQTSGNLTETGNTLLELVKYQNLILYPDADMRTAVGQCVAKESSRGWRIAKTTASARIDVVVALSLACLGAVRGGQTQVSGFQAMMHLDSARREVAAGAPIAEAAASVGLGADEVSRWIQREAAPPARAQAQPPPRHYVQPPDAPIDPAKPRWSPWCGTPEK